MDLPTIFEVRGGQRAEKEDAAVIGEMREEPARLVLSVSSYGGTRIIDMLVGDPLPRIC
jgi:hydrogenase expression/formation protein HypE